MLWEDGEHQGCGTGARVQVPKEKEGKTGQHFRAGQQVLAVIFPGVPGASRLQRLQGEMEISFSLTDE